MKIKATIPPAIEKQEFTYNEIRTCPGLYQDNANPNFKFIVLGGGFGSANNVTMFVELRDDSGTTDIVESSIPHLWAARTFVKCDEGTTINISFKQ